METATNTYQIRQLDRGRWVRDIEQSDGGLHAVHLAGRRDISAIYRAAYESKCGWCWLNATHSAAAHEASKQND